VSEIAPPLPRNAPVNDLDEDIAISVTSILDKVWHFFISMRTGLVLILILAALSLVGTMVMQAPPGLMGDAQAYASWLDSLRPKYGGWTNVLDALGFLSIFNAVYFKGTMVLLITSVVACSINRAPFLWKQATQPRLRMTESFFEHAALHATLTGPADEDAVLAEVEAAFRGHHYRTVVEREGDTIHLFADRFRWGPFGTVIAHLSLIVILTGVLVGSALGFRDPEFAASIGTRVDVGNGTGLTLVAKSFTDTYSTENGAPSDYQSDLVIYRGEQQVAAQTIRVNQPLRVGDVTFYQSFFGPAAAIQVKDGSGALIFDEGVPLLWGSKDETERIGRFSLPGQGLQAYVVSAASGKVSKEVKPGQVQVELYKSGTTTPLDIKVIDQGKPATVGGLTVTFAREHQFTGLIVARDPGVLFVWVGSILLVLGVCLVFFFTNRRAWALIRPRDDGTTSVHVGAAIRHDVAYDTDFRKFIDGLELALGHRAAQYPTSGREE
jgi:cytochrome c biogenesis protein